MHTPKNKNSAAIWLRVSSEEQAQSGSSLEVQEQVAAAYVREHSFEVVRRFRVWESALKPESRKRFAELVGFFRDELAKPADQRCQNLVVAWQDRVARNHVDIAKLLGLGVTIHVAGEGRVINEDSSPEDVLQTDIRTALSKYDSRHKGRVTAESMKAKAKRGIFPGHAPVGYRNVSEGTHRYIDLDPERAPLVRELFELAATGHYSLSQLTRHANAIGLTSRRGNRISNTALTNLLKSDFYAGVVRWGEVVQLAGQHPALISQDLFRQVQAQFQRRGPNAPKERTHKHTYQGLLRCRHCGRAIVPDKKTKKSGKSYTYYFCPAKDCGTLRREERHLDGAFQDALRGLRWSGEAVEVVARMIATQAGSAARGAAHKRQVLKSQLSRLEGRRLEAYRDLQDGVIDLEVYRTFDQEFGADLRAKKRALEAIEIDAGPQLSVGRIAYLADRLPALFESMPAERKRVVVESIFGLCRWDGQSLYPEINEPFSSLCA